MEPFNFSNNPVLSGADGTERIVAAELAGRFIRLFLRTTDGVIFHDDPFHPFILLEDEQLLDRFGGEFSITPLAGESGYRSMATFRDWHDCLAARDHLAHSTRVTTSAPGAPYLYISDPVHQHLLLTGKTLFKGLPFAELKRLALDIETSRTPGFEFSNPERAGDAIISIAVMDSEGYAEVLSATDMSEADMLRRLTTIIQERDPDVIEGHNIFRFDLEYLRVRAERHGVGLSWGRNGAVPRVHRSRFTVAERIIDYPRWDIFGRSIIDTYFLLQVYDVSSRELESYGLKQAAIHFGLAAPERVYLDRREMDRIFREEPERLKQYNLDDVRETLALSQLLSYPYFLQTSCFPYSYQNCLIRGNATRINSLFLREYLRQRTAIPRAGGDGNFAGGYTHVYETGVVGPILHCDVASLYPSIMLTFGLEPSRDPLGLFLPLLRDLREFRLQAKAAAKGSVDPHRRDYFQALQQTFKILINSFYGYLGTTIHNFADVSVAAEVTRHGREIIAAMLSWLQKQGARPVEVDTDGIYFIPPAGIVTADDEEQLVERLSATLPAGISVELDGRYRTMFSYKMKNYALLDYEGRVTIKGSSLKSRGIERYLREFTREAVRLLLLGQGEEIEKLYRDYEERLRNHTMEITWLAKTETLRESPALYRQKVRQGKRNPAAAFELALASGTDFRAGDQISYYIAGSGKGVTAYENCRSAAAYDPGHPDENVTYYLEKLKQLRKRFSGVVPRQGSLFD